MRWAFEICSRLGIDDPVYWMDTVSPQVLDRWIAFIVTREEKTSDSTQALEERFRGF